MNYLEIHNKIIKNAKSRINDENSYYEVHHIIPRCLGGNEEKENLVKLTPEEHYIIHQLLVKIYPEEKGLIYAAYMMCTKSKNQKRNNKIYGWLKKRYSVICKERLGKKNGSYGSFWITNEVENNKIKKYDSIPEGWRKGRKIKPNKEKRPLLKKCFVDGCVNLLVKGKFCENHKLEALYMYESGDDLEILFKKFGWKCEQNISSYLSKTFPERKKFQPKKRKIC